MGMNIGRNLVGNLPQMNKAAETKQTGIEQKPQTIKNTDVKFPEEKPDVEKTHYNSKDEFNNALKDGKIKNGDSYSDGKDTYLVHVTNDGQIKTERLKPRTFGIFS